MEGEGTPASARIAERLTRLIEIVHPPGRRYSTREIAKTINDRAGRHVMSHTWLNDLQRGVELDPGIKRLEALAAFFGVTLLYFVDDDVALRTSQQLEMLAALRDHGVRSMALRSPGLSDRSLSAIVGMMDNAREIEGLPKVVDDDQE